MLDNCYATSIILLTIIFFAVLFMLNYLFKIAEEEKEISPQDYADLIAYCKKMGGGKVLKRFYSDNKSVISKKNCNKIKKIVRGNYYLRMECGNKKISKFELSKIISTM